MRPLSGLFILAVAAGALDAEFLHVEQAVGGLDCVSCAQSVDRTLKRIKGVESVTFRTIDAVAVLELKPGNTTPLEEIRDAVKRIGYTPKEATVRVRGQARMDGQKWVFRVAGSDAEYLLEAPDQGITEQLRQGAGEISIVGGSIAAERGAPLKASSVRRGE